MFERLVLIQKFIIRIINKIRKISIIDTVSVIINKKVILFWSDNKETELNFGDAINPFLFEKLTGREVSSAVRVINLLNKPTFYFIGSILNNLNKANAIICGAGFISEDATIKKKPSSIIAVRGPLTREIFLKNHVSCPEVYCDPALVLPYFIPNISKIAKVDVGIIAHFIDKERLEKLNIIGESLTFKFIDIESEKDIFIQDIWSCKCIISSSLHGIIVAHAYKIPATWIKLSNNLIGNDFKFRDYALSTGNQNISPYEVNLVLDLQDAIKHSFLYDVSLNQKQFIIALKNKSLLSGNNIKNI